MGSSRGIRSNHRYSGCCDGAHTGDGEFIGSTRLGAGIAVAFVATIYGVGLADLAFLPVANKLKALVARQVLMREMLVDGLVGIAKGENPRLITGRLKGYLI